jgi:hypothetical protein
LDGVEVKPNRSVEENVEVFKCNRRDVCTNQS